jgi:hypothetical protein
MKERARRVAKEQRARRGLQACKDRMRERAKMVAKEESEGANGKKGVKSVHGVQERKVREERAN